MLATSFSPLPDVPLNKFQLQYNHALLTVFAGYHSDAFWENKHKSDEVDDDALAMTVLVDATEHDLSRNSSVADLLQSDSMKTATEGTKA